ncbi:hypothetical protein FKM82_004082 [Ascaphus truei]
MELKWVHSAVIANNGHVHSLSAHKSLHIVTPPLPPHSDESLLDEFKFAKNTRFVLFATTQRNRVFHQKKSESWLTFRRQHVIFITRN